MSENMVDLSNWKKAGAKKAGLKGPLTVTIVLGGVEYEVRELPSRKNKVWREQVQSQIQELSGVVELALSADIQSPEGIAGLVEKLGSQVIGSFDVMLDLIQSYAIGIEVDREALYDSEVVPAFLEVLKLGFPFGSAGIGTSVLSTVLDSSGRRPPQT